MALSVSVQQLRQKSSLHLQGEIEAKDLGIVGLDSCILPELPLKYDLEAEMSCDGILLQGSWEISVKLVCVRCLKQFQEVYRLESWTAYAALKGEDRLEVENDCVDLTPVLREDILLAFPLHPVCETGCTGLSEMPGHSQGSDDGARKDGLAPSIWDELDKLKLH